jgi:hypothetical protein
MIVSENVGEALLQTLYAQRALPRGDELLTHVSDLTKCLRDVAYRRRGYTPAPFTPSELAKFAIGHAYEENAAKTLREAGHEVQENVVVAGFGLDTGHPDFIVDRALLVETKTTDGGAVYPKSHKRAGELKEVSVNHAIQASAYALELELPKAIVLVKHAGYNHDEMAHVIEPEDYREQIEHLARQVVALTGPDMPLPPAVPPSSDVVPYDSCDYCKWYICHENPHHAESTPL